MFRFVPDHLKTKKMRKNAVKKLLFIIKYIPDPCKAKVIKKCVIKLSVLLLQHNFCS